MIKPAHDRIDLPKQHVGHRCRLEAALAAFKELQPRLPLQLCQKIGDAGLGNAQLFGGPGHRARIDNGVKRLKLTESQGHAGLPCCYDITKNDGASKSLYLK